MDFWNRFAGFYDLAEVLNGKVYREMTAITARLVPRGAKVLDCAAGTGELSIAAAKKAESVLCTDNSEGMLKVAEKKAKDRRLKNISFEQRNIFHLSEEDGYFDVVIAGNVLHLLDDPEAAVRELYRVTKKGGRILLPTFTLENSRPITELMLSIYKKLGFNPSTEYSPKSYVEMLKKTGCGTVKAKLIRGMIPCCYGVIIKD